MADCDKWIYESVHGCGEPIACPLGVIGDRLVVKEQWAVRGKHLDVTSELDIHTNMTHYEIWRRSQCYDGNGERFNLDFLGKWRAAETMPTHKGCTLLDVTGVRVGRAHNMSDDEAVRSGYPVGLLSMAQAWKTERPGVWDANKWLWIGTVSEVAS